MADPHDAATHLPTASVGAIDEDLFCLDCGYNLRGLRGDPVRCPECGHDNDLGTVSIPASLIRTALHEMETYPTMCVALSVGLFLSLVISAFESDARVFGLLGILIFAIGWASAYGRVRKTFRDAVLRRTVMTDFHLITLVFLTPFILSVLLLVLIRSPRDEGAVFVLFLVAVAVCWTISIRRYKVARHRLALGQREAAVRIARETLNHIFRDARASGRRELRRERHAS